MDPKVTHSINLVRQAADLLRLAAGQLGDLECDQAADELVRLQARIAGRYAGHKLAVIGDELRREVQR